MMAKKEVCVVKEVTFAKAKLLTARVFANVKDIIAVVVTDGEEITLAEAETRVNEFLKGKVE